MMGSTTTGSPPHVPLPVSIIETYSLIGQDHENGSSPSSSGHHHQPRLSAFVVRLTDASLKALNQAVSDAKQKKPKWTDGYVELTKNGTDGIICFGGAAPIGQQQTSSSAVVHRFSLADAQRDLGPKGQLDVIEQARSVSNGKKEKIGALRSIGPVTQRMQISATAEDTFEKTKQKTQLANEEMKRTAAKVALNGPTGRGGANGSGGSAGVKAVWQKINNAKAGTSQRPITPLSHHQKSSSSSNKTTSSSSSTKEDITKRSMRQRILYKLLTNSMTAVELLSKLSSEGLSDQERGTFDRTLNEIAQVSGGANGGYSSAEALSNYELKRGSYSEIRLDEWPFYNAWERQQAHKKLLMIKNSSSQSQLNGNHHHHHQNSSSSSAAADDNNTTKRVSGKISYRPPPKKPAQVDSSPKMVPSSTTVSPPMPPSVPNSSLSSPPVASPNGAPPPIVDDHHNTTQRVSAKISYKPPVKKSAISPPTITNGKSPPAAPNLLPSPPPPPSVPPPLPPPPPPPPGSSSSNNATSPTPGTAMTTAYSPPPKKKARKDNMNEASTTATIGHASSNGKNVSPSAPVNGTYEFETDDRRKRRQQHQPRPALISSNHHHQTNGHSKEHPMPPSSNTNTVIPPTPSATAVAPTVVPPTPVDQHPLSLDDTLEDWSTTNSHGPSTADYRNEYPPVTTVDGRRRYKEEFDREYPAYLKLYSRLRTSADEFEKMGARLKRAIKDSDEYKSIEREIFDKYRRYVRDAEMLRSRREHERLRKKLAVIKERVKEYDDRLALLPTLNGISDW